MNAGVVDRNAQAAEARLRGVEQRIDIALDGNIGRLRPNAIGPVGRSEPCALSLKLARIARAQHHIGGLRQEMLSDRRAKALAGAGDDSGAAGEAHARHPVDKSIGKRVFRRISFDPSPSDSA